MYLYLLLFVLHKQLFHIVVYVQLIKLLLTLIALYIPLTRNALRID